MSGTEVNTFSPNANTTRGMMASILYRMVKGETTIQNSFDDVKQDAYYADAVSCGVENGVLSGYTNTAFAPDDSVTREQLVTMLYRYQKAQAPTEDYLKDYADGKYVSSYAKNAMNWAIENHIITGRGDKMLASTDCVTRAEVATIMMNFANSFAK